MFEDAEKRMKKSKKLDHLQSQMVSSLPQINHALQHPSAMSVAVGTRIQIQSAQQEIQVYLKKNPNPSEQQREMFNNILDRFQNITNKLTKTKYKTK